MLGDGSRGGMPLGLHAAFVVLSAAVWREEGVLVFVCPVCSEPAQRGREPFRVLMSRDLYHFRGVPSQALYFGWQGPCPPMPFLVPQRLKTILYVFGSLQSAAGAASEWAGAEPEH